ncbi:MAG TPA: hypothetical protein PKE57_03855, partial [Cellvibrionaceae bacterium]|nr:hypothetical protein [Cellvibrionaceae bacterium]
MQQPLLELERHFVAPLHRAWQAFTTPQGLEILLKASPGSAGRNKTLGLDRFISNSIPLPSIA